MLERVGFCLTPLKMRVRVSEEVEGLTGLDGFLRNLDALTSAIRSKRCTSVSTKLSCLPFESYLEQGMSVAKGVPKYEGRVNDMIRETTGV